MGVFCVLGAIYVGFLWVGFVGRFSEKAYTVRLANMCQFALGKALGLV